MRYAFALAAAVSCTSPAFAQNQTDPSFENEGEEEAGTRLYLSTGLDYESGDFGTQADIEKVTVPLTASLTTGRLRASVQLPLIRVTAPGNVIAPTGPLGLPILVDPTRPSEVETREGLGDLRIGLAYDLPVQGFFASVRTGAKVPAASAEEGLGTGKADYSVGADIAKQVGKVIPFAGITYTIAGDPENYDLRNSLSAQAGAALRLGEATTAQVSYAYAQSPLEEGVDDQRIVGGINTEVGESLSLGVYGSGGLTSGAPDVGGGVTLGFRFGR